MKNPQIPPVRYFASRNCRRRTAVWLLTFVLAPLMAVAEAQDSHTAAHAGQSAGDELQARAEAAQAALNRQNPEDIAHANRLLLATALRESADLKILEGQAAAALDLYGQSAALEPSSRTYLAMAYATRQWIGRARRMRLNPTMRTSIACWQRHWTRRGISPRR
jgi:hypothetical protein